MREPSPRDHHAVRAFRDGIVNPIGQLQSPGCGAWFLLARTLARHREKEIPRLLAENKARAEAWEARRRRAPTLLTRDQIAELELRRAGAEPGPLRVVEE